MVRDLEVRTYYIANDSVQRPDWPALRVKALTESRGAAQFRDEEILPGVEDLQVEIGVASRGRDGTARVPTSRRTRRAHVRAAWSRCACGCGSAPTPPNPASNDGRTLTYANVTFTPSPAEAQQRRMLIERTVALRNARLP